tara:strand:+ start:3122 stop:4492 length:1371 start_codon:yes stop_codon:yes gene_type:complete
MENNNSAFSYKLTKLDLIDNSSKTWNLIPGAQAITYFESITDPYVSANIRILDSGESVINKIVGGEEVHMSVAGPDETEYHYILMVYMVGDRSVSNKTQTYNIGLISAEALTNESMKISKTLTGRPDVIAKEILEDEKIINTEKDFFGTPCQNNTKIHPNGKSPFQVIASLCNGSVSSTNSNVDGSTSSSTTNTDKEVGGSAGYVFFENRKGYHFKSIDSLCDTKGHFGGGGKVRSFTDSVNDGVNEDSIINVNFESEINLIHALRLGTYSSQLQTYDISSGKFEVYTYNLSKEWDNQSHLGSQTKLNPMQEKLSSHPTRILSTIVDHEKYYTGTDTADPDDPDYKNDNNFWDYSKHHIAQNISRNFMLNTQGLRIDVPGNIDLCVGEIINVILPSSVSEDQKLDEPIDESNSGFYLVSSLSRFFDQRTQEVTTVLKLKRDSFGAQQLQENEVLLS